MPVVPLTIWTIFDACGPPLPFDPNVTPVVPPYNLTKFDACGPPVPFDPNLMLVVPPYHLNNIWCLWSPLTISTKFDACGPPLPFEQYLMPVVPPYYLTQIWCQWSSLTYIIALIALCELKMERRLTNQRYIIALIPLCRPNLMPVVPHLPFEQYLMPAVPLTMLPKFDACDPPYLYYSPNCAVRTENGATIVDWLIKAIL